MKKASKGNKYKFKSSRKKTRQSFGKNKIISTDLCIDATGLDLKDLLEKHGCQLKPKESTNRYSKLSPTLADILKNTLYMGYFIEFLDMKAVRHLADFWLAADAFHIVSSERFHKDKIKRQYPLRNGECTNEAINSDGDCESPKNVTTILNDAYNHVSNEVEENGRLSCEYCRELQLRQTVKKWTAGKTTSDHCSIEGKLSDREKQIILPGQHGSNTGNTGNSAQCIHCGSCEFPEPLLNVQFQCDWKPFSLNGNSASPELDLSRIKYQDSDLREESPHWPLRRVMTRETRRRTKSAVVDAIGIYTKYISLDAEIAIGLSSDARRKVEAEICKDRNSINPECFSEVQEFVHSKLEEYLVQFMESSFGSKYQLNILESNKLNLQDILYNEISSFNFTEFLEREQSQIVLEFWFIAEGFEINLSKALQDESYIADEALEDAMIIYERYFSMCASNRLIKDDKLRIVIENNICRENGPQPNCFCIPMAYAWTALKEIFFPRFLESDIYCRFLENLYKNSITGRSINDEASSITSSDFRGEHEEVLLLSEDFLNKDFDDMWYRPAAGRLALGHVDECGNFIPEMEAEPDDEAEHSSVSKLGKRMRNLLVRESVVDKERVAWEKARKIIEDVQRHNK